MDADKARALCKTRLKQNENIDKIVHEIFCKIKYVAEEEAGYSFTWVMPAKPPLSEEQLEKIIKSLNERGYECVYLFQYDRIKISWDEPV